MRRPGAVSSRVLARAGGIPALAMLALAVACATASAAPSAVIRRVQLLPRADLSARAWSKSDDAFRRSYVYPPSRQVRLNACGSSVDSSLPAAGVPALAWRLEPMDGQSGATALTAAGAPGQCSIETAVKALGRWRITLTATNQARESVEAATEVTFRDIIVAAVGDSFASGEGTKVKGPAGAKGWIDPQCHRSYDAWPAFVARALENDSTAVTYLSVACSGSDISQVVNTTYRGVEGGPKLQPQIQALRDVIGDPTLPGTRPVTVLLGATGINTIAVAGSLINCVADSIVDFGLEALDVWFECREDLSGLISTLPRLYDGLELAISANLRVAQTHLIGYPARIMTNASDAYPKQVTGLLCRHLVACVADALTCGTFANTTVADKQWLTRTAESINSRLRAAGSRNGWTITPTLDLFRGKGYCARSGVTWFRGLAGSLALQGDTNGTAHPNRKGHKAAAEAVLPRINPTAEAPAPDQFVVGIRKLQVTLPKVNDRFEQPHQVGETKVNIFGATHVSCGTPGVDTTPASRLRSVGRSAEPCTDLRVLTAGKTINLRVSAKVTRFVPSQPQNPAEPGAGHSKTVKLQAQRRHLRAANWDATVSFPGAGPPFAPKVHRLVAGSTRGDFGRLVLEYTITKQAALAPSWLR